jgi:branched-chain amino acid aminotransferase
MGIESEWIWFDGKLVPYAEAQVHVLSHTLHYGLGAFEGIRAYEQPDGRPGIWRLREHLDRLLDSMRMVTLPIPWSRDQLAAACLEVLAANKFTEAYIRPLAFLGHGAMGLGARNNPVHVVVAAWKWGAYLGEEGLAKGVRLRTSSFTRNHPNAALSRAKVVGHYVNSIMARYEATADGFDEALMLDNHGFVAEGTGENVFAIKNGVVKTPSVSNILPGITRRSVIEILAHEGIPVREENFGRDAFYVADEAFMCGTAAEITPIAEVDRRTIGLPGPITKTVQRLYTDGVHGRVDWLRKHITTPG